MPEKGKFSIRMVGLGRARIQVDGNPEAWAATRRLVQEQARSHHMPGGQIIELPFAELLSFFRRFNSILAPSGLTIDVDPETRAQIVRANSEAAKIEDAKNVTPIKESDLLTALQDVSWNPQRRLTKEQIRNVCRLAALPHGASFSVPGAGKTTEALATYAFKTRLQQPLFVVAPKNAFAAWEEQVAVCLPQLKVTRLTGASNIPSQLNASPQISLITYSQLIFVEEAIFNHLCRRPSFMILDESHRIKGGEARSWGKSVLAVSHLPTGKLVLSGTPMPNDASDLMPQVRFLYPSVPLNADPVSTIKNVYVRTTKTELNLPPIKAAGTPIPLSDAQSRLYRLCATEVARDAEATLKSRDRSALRSFGRSYMLLLQLVSNPSLLARHQHKFNDALLTECLASESPKVAYVCHRARRLAAEGKKVLIWSGFVSNVEIIAERLADLGADYIHGQVATDSLAEDEEDIPDDENNTREAKIRRFHEDSSAMVLVANPAACSEGISLHTVCHHAIYLDRDYNAAKFLQSQDRIHRLGIQPGIETSIEYVYCPGTIDESVARRLNWKIQQMERALQDDAISIPTHWRTDLSEDADCDDVIDLLQTLRANEV